MTSEVPRTPRLKAVLDAAEQLATGRGDGYLGVEHVMLAILADGESVPTQELREMGIDPAGIADQLTSTMDSDSFRQPARRARFLDGRVIENGRVITNP